MLNDYCSLEGIESTKNPCPNPSPAEIAFTVEFVPVLEILYAYADRIKPGSTCEPMPYADPETFEPFGLSLAGQYKACCLAEIIREWAELKKEKINGTR